MKNKSILKIIAVAVLAVMVTLTLASCATGGTSVAKDASGEGWEYKKDGQTLTITSIPAYEGDATPWKNVASSVKSVSVGDGVTAIPNYAFYNMTVLESVKLSPNVVSIGNLAFAFTPALKSVDIPANVNSIGEAAFEASGITAIELPSTVTVISPRTFLYCDDLVSVVGAGVTSVGRRAFSYCRKLDSVKLAEGATATEDAFLSAKEGVAITKADGLVSVTFRHVNEADGSAIEGQADVKLDVEANKTHKYTVPAINGYTPVLGEIEYAVESVNREVTVNYKKIEEVTESAPAETEADPSGEEEKPDVWTWIALGGTVVILIGVAVAVILFVRRDKKNGGGNGTVRKNKDAKKDSKGKK